MQEKDTTKASPASDEVNTQSGAPVKSALMPGVTYTPGVASSPVPQQAPVDEPPAQNAPAPELIQEAPIAPEGQPAQSIEGAVEAEGVLTWQASEFVFQDKNSTWYLGLIGFVLAGAAILAFFKQWLGIAVLIAMALAIAQQARRTPRVLTYTLTNEGVTIDGVLQSYNHFRSFGVVNDVAWHAIDLEPVKRFVPRLTVLCDADDIEAVEAALALHLPRQDRPLDFIERATRYFRF